MTSDKQQTRVQHVENAVGGLSALVLLGLNLRLLVPEGPPMLSGQLLVAIVIHSVFLVVLLYSIDPYIGGVFYFDR